MSQGARAHYTAVAIVLHWAIAISIFAMIPLGWWMSDALHEPATRAQAFGAFQLHKSVGLSILALSLVRLGWRLINPAPPFPAHMPRWERVAASATHWAFYVLILAMPLSGWLYVSTGWSADEHRAFNVPTIFFGLFPVPHLLGLAELDAGARATLAGVLEFIHSKLAWVMIVLAALHVAAALKHQFVDRDEVLGHMVPGLGAGPRGVGRKLALGAGTALIAAALIAGVSAFVNLPVATAPTAPPPVAAQAPTQTAPETPAPAAEAETPTAAPETPTQSPTPAAAPSWRVDPAASSIVFAGVHAGQAFEGRFAQWSADIRFDADHLGASSARVSVRADSASTGAALYDESLPQPEWFDAAHHANITFRTTSIRKRGEGYEAVGSLTLKGKAIPVTLPFTLSIDGARAVMDGTTQIDRAAADLGQQSDPDGEWVAKTVEVRVHVEAARAP